MTIADTREAPTAQREPTPGAASSSNLTDATVHNTAPPANNNAAITVEQVEHTQHNCQTAPEAAAPAADTSTSANAMPAAGAGDRGNRGCAYSCGGDRGQQTTTTPRTRKTKTENDRHSGPQTHTSPAPIKQHESERVVASSRRAAERRPARQQARRLA